MLAIAIAAACVPTLLAADLYSASCSGSSGNFQCSLTRGVADGAAVTGRFYDEVNQTGWGRLFIASEAVGPHTAYAAGYLEGALTAKRIVQHLTNYKAYYNLEPLPQNIQEFVQTSDVWAREQIRQRNRTDDYWNQVAFMYDQMDGMLKGANDHLGTSQHLSLMDVLLLNLQGDVEDIQQAVDSTLRPNFADMNELEVELWQRKRSHCSALVKLVPDGSDLFAGHNMWWSYYAMLRIFKRYEFGSSKPIALSSYPGILASTDDFYQIGDLVVMETTNPNYNNELFALVTAKALPYWLRAMTANFLASSGPEWMEIFQRHNSGTYNNMWMVIDYSKFTPGKPLLLGTLTVGEQLPGYFHYEDQTKVLSYGYWPSYNKALYPETARLIGQDVMAEQRGPAFSYQQDVRAQIFRRDQGKIAKDEDVQRALRYNDYKRDPLARGNPCSQLACRGDLAQGPAASGNGAVDAKYTSSAHVRAGRTVVVSGPTHDDQPVFDWATAPASVRAVSHVGQPTRFDFDWVVMGADTGAAVEAWQSKQQPASQTLWPAGLEDLALALLASLACGSAVFLWRRFSKHATTAKGLGADSYHKLSPGGFGWKVLSPTERIVGA